MEKKLKEREQWLFTTLKSIGDAVITTDTKGDVTFMNPVAQTLTGWKQEEVEGKNMLIYRHNAERLSQGECAILSGYYNHSSYIVEGMGKLADTLYTIDHGLGRIIKDKT